ncbi:hypothetical protein [Cohnella soli]|uniref:Uncharacterized protein n=1 Tax=Cohnella soli TaxID=425005 RepID=A0ABW0HWB7_9BACL
MSLVANRVLQNGKEGLRRQQLVSVIAEADALNKGIVIPAQNNDSLLRYQDGNRIVECPRFYGMDGQRGNYPRRTGSGFTQRN